MTLFTDTATPAPEPGDTSVSGIDRPVPFALTPKAHAVLMPPVGIHTWFSLSYANYLVLPRTLLQSMPLWWQHRLTALLDDLGDAFAHVPQAEAYNVTAAVEREVSSLTPAELQAAGISAEDPVCRLDHDHDDAERADCWLDVTWHNTRDGRELAPDDRVLVPVPDPVPPYNRGRTRIHPHGIPAPAEEGTPDGR